MHESRQINAILPVICLTAAVLTGCANTADSPLPAPATRPLSGYATPGVLQIDIDTLEKLLPRAFSALHWGNIHVINEITALSAQALTPDDRLVHITSQTVSNGIAVQCRVGEFGDKGVEDELLATLHGLAEEYAKARKRN